MKKIDYQAPELIEMNYKMVVSGASCQDYTVDLDGDSGCSIEQESPIYE